MYSYISDKHAINKLHDYMKFHSTWRFSLFVLLAVIELEVNPKKTQSNIVSPNPNCASQCECVRVCACVCLRVFACGTYNALLVETAEITRGRGGLPVMLALHRILRPVRHNAYRPTGIARRGRTSISYGKSKKRRAYINGWQKR